MTRGPARMDLTRRQAEVLDAASTGATLAAIAAELGTSREQVASRLSEAYKRLGVAWMEREDRREAAVRVARKRGLIPPQHGAAATGSAPEGSDGRRGDPARTREPQEAREGP